MLPKRFPGVGAFDHLEWTYDGAFEQLFGLGRGEFEQKFSENSNARGGMLKLRFDWYIRGKSEWNTGIETVSSQHQRILTLGEHFTFHYNIIKIKQTYHKHQFENVCTISNSWCFHGTRSYNILSPDAFSMHTVYISFWALHTRDSDWNTNEQMRNSFHFSVVFYWHYNPEKCEPKNILINITVKSIGTFVGENKRKYSRFRYFG